MSRNPQVMLFVHPSDELYGADRCLLDIITGLPDDFQTIVVLPTDIKYSGGLSVELARLNVRVERIDMLVLRRALMHPRTVHLLIKRLVLGSWELARLCRRYNAQIVHSNTVAVPGGAIAAAVNFTPHVWHIHEYIGDEAAPFKRFLRSMLTALPGRIVANSKATARALVAGNRRTARKTRVIYNGVAIAPDQHFEPSGASEAKDTVRICVIGRLTPRKGIGEALQAARLLIDRGHIFQMLFIGDAPPGQQHFRRDYELLALELGIANSVDFRGEQQNSNIAFNSTDILLAPSQRPEGFGLTIVEAMSNRVPVVAVRNGGGSDELIEDMRTGIYCDRDPQSIAGGLERLIGDPGLRVRLADNAYTEVQRRFSLESYQHQFLRLYRQIREP